MKIEEIIKQKLLKRGYNSKNILENTSAIEAIIDETILEVIKTMVYKK